MVIKILGAIFTVFATSMIGFYYSQKDKYRIADLEEMKRALTIFNGEMSYTAMPLAEMFSDISQRITGISAFILEQTAQRINEKTGKAICEIWEEVLCENESKTYYAYEDMKAFFAFGKALGFSDRNQQINNANLTICYIESKISQLAKRNANDAKLYRSMGILSGVLICVVLF